MASTSINEYEHVHVTLKPVIHPFYRNWSWRHPLWSLNPIRWRLTRRVHQINDAYGVKDYFTTINEAVYFVVKWMANNDDICCKITSPYLNKTFALKRMRAIGEQDYRSGEPIISCPSDDPEKKREYEIGWKEAEATRKRIKDNIGLAIASGHLSMIRRLILR